MTISRKKCTAESIYRCASNTARKRRRVIEWIARSWRMM